MHQGSNPFAYPKPITLDTLDDLFAHHRDRFGGFRMEGDGGDGGGSGGDDGGSGGGSGDDGKGGDDFTAITSQEEFNKRLSDRLRREREKFADYDDLKQKAAEHDKAVEAAKTDSEKAVEAARKEGETTARQAADARIIRAEAKVALAGAKARNATAAVKLLDLSGITVGDDGEVDSKALEAKVAELKASEAYLFDDGKGKGPKPDHSQGGDGDDSPKTIKQVMEERRAAREAKQ